MMWGFFISIFFSYTSFKVTILFFINAIFMKFSILGSIFQNRIFHVTYPEILNVYSWTFGIGSQTQLKRTKLCVSEASKGFWQQLRHRFIKIHELQLPFKRCSVKPRIPDHFLKKFVAQCNESPFNPILLHKRLRLAVQPLLRFTPNCLLNIRSINFTNSSLALSSTLSYDT